MIARVEPLEARSLLASLAIIELEGNVIDTVIPPAPYVFADPYAAEGAPAPVAQFEGVARRRVRRRPVEFPVAAKLGPRGDVLFVSGTAFDAGPSIFTPAAGGFTLTATDYGPYDPYGPAPAPTTTRHQLQAKLAPNGVTAIGVFTTTVSTSVPARRVRYANTLAPSRGVAYLPVRPNQPLAHIPRLRQRQRIFRYAVELHRLDAPAAPPLAAG